MNEQDIQNFWNQNPCGDSQVGGLQQRDGNYVEFFKAYDKFRYEKEGHILGCLDAIDLSDKRVLEIGLGQGADSEQLIKRGARWSGLDLTPESVARVQMRMKLHNLSYDEIRQGSALLNPYPDRSFDIVFSHGVFHHIPDIVRAQKEVHRVLKPGGQFIVMLYAKWSLNYLASIGVARRIGLLAMYLTGRRAGGVYGQHLANAKNEGIFSYLRMTNFVHRNTDGPLNPYSKVYDVAMVKQDFPDFAVIKAYKVFMHAPPLPVRRLPLSRQLGWHLWVHLLPKVGG